MINNAVLVGRMTRDAELRYTPQNVAVATFTLAVNRTFKSYDNQQGQRVYVTEVVAETFQMLESRNQQSSNDTFGNDNPMDIQDDDLPF